MSDSKVMAVVEAKATEALASPAESGRLIKKQSKTWLIIGYALLAVIFLVLPFKTNYDVLVEDIIVWSLYTMGYNLCFGFTGMPSVGHGIFFGVCAFTVGILSLFWQPSIITVPIGIVVGTIVSVVVGYASLKRARLDVHRALRVSYMVLISIAASYIFMYLFLQPLAQWSGAEMGLLGFPDHPMHVVGGVSINFQSHTQIYIIVGVVSLILIGIMHYIANSPAALVMRAVRENELRVGFLGYNTFRFKLIVYTFSGFVASVAGCLYLFRSGFIDASVFDFTVTSELVVICLLGGVNMYFGPMIGTAIYLVLKDVVSSYTNSWALVIALVLVFSVLYLPNGVGPVIVSAPGAVFRLFRGPRRVVASTTEATNKGTLSFLEVLLGIKNWRKKS